MSLLENIVAKSRKINFDMSKSLNENIYATRDRNPDNRLPVVTIHSSWETRSESNSAYMIKTYQFDIYKHLIYFTTSILEQANKIKHHPIILIDEDLVEIKLFTKDLNDVTESDIELSKFIDEIYQEINYILEF
jgi:pterin-4a-carbinolamine dehydratase